MLRLRKAFVVCVLWSALLLSGQAQSNQPTADETAQTMKALLHEVRELRVTLQQISFINYNAQITLERMRLQQQTTERLTMKLENNRLRLSNIKLQRNERLGAIKELENELAGTSDKDERKDIERRLAQHKNQLEKLAVEEQELRERELSAAAELQREQNRLAELQDRLDSIQREMETQRPAEKSPPAGKRP